MILGRTPEGLIKIKKDDPLGLRAVNCACCGCGCYSISIPSALRPLFETANISNLSAFGVPAASFEYLGAEFSGGIENDIWFADFTDNLPAVYPIEYVNMGFYYQKSTGCLSMGRPGEPSFVDAPSFVIYYTDPLDDYYVCVSYGFPGSSGWSGPSSLGCANFISDLPAIDSTFTINGEGAFPFWYFTTTQDDEPCSAITFPPLNIVFT